MLRSARIAPGAPPMTTVHAPGGAAVRSTTCREPWRPRFQFSLRTLLVFVGVSAVGLSWLSVYRGNRQGIAAVRQCGGRLTFHARGSQTDFDVYEVRLNKTRADDSVLRRLQGMKSLAILDLGNTEVTDAGLKYLEGLENLQMVVLRGTAVTDDGMKHLEGLTGLRRLSLSGTRVTDSGLVHLRELRKKHKYIKPPKR